MIFFSSPTKGVDYVQEKKFPILCHLSVCITVMTIFPINNRVLWIKTVFRYNRKYTTRKMDEERPRTQRKSWMSVQKWSGPRKTSVHIIQIKCSTQNGMDRSTHITSDVNTYIKRANYRQNFRIEQVQYQ